MLGMCVIMCASSPYLSWMQHVCVKLLYVMWPTPICLDLEQDDLCVYSKWRPLKCLSHTEALKSNEMSIYLTWLVHGKHLVNAGYYFEDTPYTIAPHPAKSYKWWLKCESSSCESSFLFLWQRVKKKKRSFQISKITPEYLNSHRDDLLHPSCLSENPDFLEQDRFSGSAKSVKDPPVKRVKDLHPRNLEPTLFVAVHQLQSPQREKANLHPPSPWKGQVRLENLEGQREAVRQRSPPACPPLSLLPPPTPPNRIHESTGLVTSSLVKDTI